MEKVGRSVRVLTMVSQICWKGKVGTQSDGLGNHRGGLGMLEVRCSSGDGQNGTTRALWRVSSHA